MSNKISGADINGRALWIACTLLTKLELELYPGKGPADAEAVRRFLRTKARKELFRERKARHDKREKRP